MGPATLNGIWTMDFMHDALYGGRRFRTLNVIDEGNREGLGIEVGTSIPAACVVRVVEQLIMIYARPAAFRLDNGPELTAQEFIHWCRRQGIELHYIQPGKPDQNAFIERFNRAISVGSSFVQLLWECYPRITRAMIQGHLHPDFWPVARQLEKQLGKPPRGGAAVCVYHRGEKVVDVWAGIKDAIGNPWCEDTMSMSFSTTKGVAATALHVLVDRGLLDYDAPVAKYWPEFAQNGKESITVRQLLCHEAGLYGIRNLIDHAKRMFDWEYMIAALARSTPAHEPGAANGYHGLTFGWLIGELVQRVTGKQLSDVIQTELAEPLKLDALYIGAPVNQLHRAAELIPPNRRLRISRVRPVAKRLQRVFSALRLPVDLRRVADALMPAGIDEIDTSSPQILTASIPSANGLFTARSLARLYAALATGGHLDGAHLLSEKTVQRATQVQNRRIDLVVPFPMHWRLGYHRAATTGGAPRRAFGHYGFGGSGAWADPDRNLAMAMVLNHGIYKPSGNLRTARMGSIVLRCADRR